MARPLRIELPNGVYHVTSRGLERRAVVRDDHDRERWTDLLDRVATRHRWKVLAWVLMRNHFHLFLRVPDGDLSRGMHDLNSGYASGFNRRHRRCGPLFQGRFKAVLVEGGAHEWELSRYVHLNPVRAGVVSEPQAYRWGSCRCYSRARLAPPWLAWEETLSAHGRTLRTARRRYQEYLREGVSSPPRSPLRDVVASSLLGSEAFVEAMKTWLADRLPDREVPTARPLRREVGVEAIEAAVAAAYGVPLERLHAKGKHGNEARQVAAHLVRELTTLPVRAIGERLGGVCGSAVSNAVGIVRARRARDWRLDRRLRSIEHRLTENEL